MRSMTEGVLLSAKLPQSPFGSGCFPTGKTPRDASRLVQPSLTEGAEKDSRISHKPVGTGVLDGPPQPKRKWTVEDAGPYNGYIGSAVAPTI